MHLVSVDIDKYIEAFSSEEDDVLSELTRETYLKVQMPQMLSGKTQGQFLEMFSRLLQPKRVLENPLQLRVVGNWIQILFTQSVRVYAGTTNQPTK